MSGHPFVCLRTTALTHFSSVMGAIMFGRKRDHTGVLIELKEEHSIDISDDVEITRARDILWSDFFRVWIRFDFFDWSDTGL